MLLLLVCENSPLETIWKSFTVTQQLAEKEDLETAVLSGRTTTLDIVIEQFKNGMPLTAIVGIGRGSQEKIIEMTIELDENWCSVLDYFEIFMESIDFRQNINSDKELKKLSITILFC